MLKLAIIGASTGQLPLCIKAREMGIQTICFAWEEGAICKDVVDVFYPISVLDKEQIVDICKKECINGVISNASDLLAEIVAYISSELCLNGNSYTEIRKLRNKRYVRNITNNIENISAVKCFNPIDNEEIKYPCVVKPISGAAKKGVSYVNSCSELDSALNYAGGAIEDIIIEEFIEGKEISVESISYKGQHYVIQITDKDSTGAPHFVELGHHQPSSLNESIKNKIKYVVPKLLNVVGFTNGATHIEFKVNENNGYLYLIEINPRGGGDEISSKLVELSTGFDYLKAMIEVALGIFTPPITLKDDNYSGVYYLCEQTRNIAYAFERECNPSWLIEKKIFSSQITSATGNYDRNGYIIYKSDVQRPLDKKDV